MCMINLSEKSLGAVCTNVQKKMKTLDQALERIDQALQQIAEMITSQTLPVPVYRENEMNEQEWLACDNFHQMNATIEPGGPGGIFRLAGGAQNLQRGGIPTESHHKVNQQEALLQAILDDPEDVGARLVYADWLEEHGLEPVRSEFIRMQCGLDGKCSCKSMLCAVCKTLMKPRQQVQDLLRDHWGLLLAPRPKDTFVWKDNDKIGYGWKESGRGSQDFQVFFRNGFVEAVRGKFTDWWEREAVIGKTLARSFPLRAVKFTDTAPERWMPNAQEVTCWYWYFHSVLHFPYSPYHHHMPKEIFDFLNGEPLNCFDNDLSADLRSITKAYATREEAEGALSRAVLLHARGNR